MAATQLTHTSKTDWQSGLLVNATWYPETQLQFDWQGSSFTTPGHSPSELWLGGWRYRRRITINNSLAYGLSDYQVWIPTSAFGAQWSAIRSSAQPTMADFRFTPSTASGSLPYWIEDNTTTPKGFWVRVSTLPAGTNTIYMYYGNASTAPVQSAKNTYVIYDDFNDGSIDNSIWSTTGNVAETGGYLRITGANSANILQSVQNFAPGIVMEWYGQISNTVASYHTNGFSSPGPMFFVRWENNPTIYSNINNTVVASIGHSAPNTANWKIIWFSTGSAAWYRNESLVSNTNTVVTSSQPIFFNVYDNGAQTNLDWISFRRLAPTEPTISSVSGEEGAFFSTGSFRSSVLDTTSKIVVSSISWNPSSQPAGTNLVVSVRASKESFAAGSPTPPWHQVSNNSNPGIVGRYIQYASTFTTSVSTATPRLEDITITYKPAKPWQEKSVTRASPFAFGFYGGDDWTWEVPVKGGTLVTITAHIRYNTEYLGGTYDKPKLTLFGRGINESISATAGAENSWEQRQLSGTPSSDGILTLKAEGFSVVPGARFYVDDINVSQ